MATVWVKEDDPAPVSAKDTVWKTPAGTITQHVTDTSSPEDLLMPPEEIQVVPEKSQYGETKWIKEEV
jgi:hypothetical protein